MLVWTCLITNSDKNTKESMKKDFSLKISSASVLVRRNILEGTNLENVESIKYLGVTITSDLRWNTHVSNVCTKANRTLGFLRRNLYSCPLEVKEAAYKGLVRPVLDYGSSVWDPPGVVFQEELKSVLPDLWQVITIMKLGVWLAFLDS